MEKASRVASLIMFTAPFFATPSMAAQCPEHRSSTLFTDFTTRKDDAAPLVDHCDWEIVSSNWGGRTETGDYSGGVIRENVTRSPDGLVLKALGNLYEGPIRGRSSDGKVRADGKRTGAALRSRRMFQGGRFEACVTIPPVLGVVSALWTFRYEEEGGNPPRNHEIDIEFPGQADAATPVDLDHVNFTTWTGLADGGHTTAFTRLPSRASDGNFHLLRFDWQPPAADTEGQVDFYFDDQHQAMIAENVPSLAGELWFGLWFPPVWAGEPNFDEAQMRVKWVRVSPLDDPRISASESQSCR